MGQKSLLICLIVIVKLENQRQFYEIYEYCQLIFDKKLQPLTKFSLYCQIKVIIQTIYKNQIYWNVHEFREIRVLCMS